MEKRVLQKVKDYIADFKTGIVADIAELNTQLDDGVPITKQDLDALINAIYARENIQLAGDDFIKRVRTKNAVPVEERCIALRANDDRCTRRRKPDMEFCGTHEKGQPHGVVADKPSSDITYTKREVWAEDFGGIIYYIDIGHNVYKTEDVMNNNTNPTIIARWISVGDTRRIDWDAA